MVACQHAGVWDSQDGSSGDMTKGEQQNSVDSDTEDSRGGNRAQKRGSEGSSNNLEQYM